MDAERDLVERDAVTRRIIDVNSLLIKKPAIREPETLSLLPPLTFSFVADFTGRLGKLHDFVLNPMVRVEKGTEYHVSVDPQTGVTLITPKGKVRDGSH